MQLDEDTIRNLRAYAFMFLLLFLCFALISCANIPKDFPNRPVIELCLFNVIKDDTGEILQAYADCGMTDVSKVTNIKQMSIDELAKTRSDIKPIEDLDKYIMTPPGEGGWLDLINHLDAVANWAKYRCQ